MAAIRALRRRADRLLRAGGTPALAAGAEPPPFSPFVAEHLDRALALTERMMRLADATPGNDGLEAALAEVEAAMADDPEAARHALMVFITHHPEGSRLPIAALEEQRPELATVASEASRPSFLESASDEALLAWFRTDPLANQHHQHWHVVYPHRGVPDANGVRRVQDRQGELFLYMHQQMLARYDAERLSAGVTPVEALEDYRAPIEVGFDPGLPDLLVRPDGAVIADVPAFNYTVANHESVRDGIRAATGAGSFGVTPITPNVLGSTIEANIGSVSETAHGRLHNLGHVLISEIGAGNSGRHGAMWSTATAIMDPVFFRWHRHVDDLGTEWQDRQPVHDFGDAPRVVVRHGRAGDSPDVTVCPVDAVPGGSAAGFDWAAWGDGVFGGPAWSQPVGTLAPAPAVLRTSFARRRRAGSTARVTYLDHDDFVWVVRARNTAARPVDVTVRIFAVPAERDADRRAWIEMDKFRHRLAARARAVIVRPSRQSAVVQKPVVRPPQPRREPGTDAATNYCNCGWPYHLLLPKGTIAGLPMRVLVMLTDWTIDQTAPDTECGSMSFCGARDSRYPDLRPMGYPFDRPLPGGVVAMLGALANVGLATFTVTHTGMA